MLLFSVKSLFFSFFLSAFVFYFSFHVFLRVVSMFLFLLFFCGGCQCFPFPCLFRCFCLPFVCCVLRCAVLFCFSVSVFRCFPSNLRKHFLNGFRPEGFASDPAGGMKVSKFSQLGRNLSMAMLFSAFPCCLLFPLLCCVSFVVPSRFLGGGYIDVTLPIVLCCSSERLPCGGHLIVFLFPFEGVRRCGPVHLALMFCSLMILSSACAFYCVLGAYFTCCSLCLCFVVVFCRVVLFRMFFLWMLWLFCFTRPLRCFMFLFGGMKMLPRLELFVCAVVCCVFLDVLLCSNWFHCLFAVFVCASCFVVLLSVVLLRLFLWGCILRCFLSLFQTCLVCFVFKCSFSSCLCFSPQAFSELSDVFMSVCSLSVFC